MPRAASFIPIAILSLYVAPLHAQVAPGDTVRIRAASLGSGVTTGVLRSVDRAELAVETDRGVVRRIPVSKLTELVRADGTRRQLGRGVILGYLSGATVGGLIGNKQGKSDDELQQVMALGGLVGIAAGAVWGQLSPVTRWNTMSLVPVRALQPGTRIRLKAGNGATLGEGELELETPDSVVFVDRDGKRVGIRRDQIGKIEWPYRVKPATWRGLGIGAGVGALTGVVAGMASGGDASCSWFCFSAEEYAVIFGVTFGVIGGGVGAVIGSVSQVTSWESVGAPGEPRVEVAPMVTARAVGVRGTIRF